MTDKTNENLPATVPDEGFPAWFDDDNEEDQYGGATGGEGTGLPFLGFAGKKTGSEGGSVTWADLNDAGCAEGDLYAFGGVLTGPVRLANVSLLLIKSMRIAFSVNESEGYKVEGIRRIDGHEDAMAGESQAFDALILVLAEGGPFLATYRDQLISSTRGGVWSAVVGPWADRIRKAEPPAGLPRWASVASRLRSESATSKSSGRTYRKQVATYKELGAAELQLLADWVRGEDGQASQGAVTEWLGRYDEPGEGEEDVPY